jgi:hypothetical protein
MIGSNLVRVCVAVDVDDLVAYAHKISYTTSAPLDWNPQLGLGRHRPPYPQDGSFKSRQLLNNRLPFVVFTQLNFKKVLCLLKFEDCRRLPMLL